MIWRQEWICLRLERHLTVHSQALSVCSFPNHSAPGSPGESLPGPGSTSHCPTVAGQSMVPIYTSLLDGPCLELPVGRDVLSQAGGFIFHPQPELWKLWAWPLRGGPAHRLRSLN